MDCLQTSSYVWPVGIQHIGFKGVAVSMETPKALNWAIKNSGAISYMEVVSDTSEACIKSARSAVEFGVDRLLGGTVVEPTLKILAGTVIDYSPLPGCPEWYPTRLGGSPGDIERDCHRFAELGCAGVDLLAYCVTETDPMDLSRAVGRGMGSHLAVAGSIDSPERICAVAEADADGFAMGTAALEGAFSPRKGALTSQPADSLETCDI